MKKFSFAAFRKISTLAVVPLTAAALLLSPISPASAAGISYDGTDPVVTGCSSDAVTISTRTYSNVDVDIRYSPSCQTNWIRVRTQATDVMTSKSIARDANPDYGISSYQTAWSDDNGNSYSFQTYAPGSTCVNAYVNIYWGEYARVFVNDWRVC